MAVAYFFAGMTKAGLSDATRTVVCTDSLQERTGFEPPVLFVVPGAFEKLEVSGTHSLKPMGDLF